MKYHTLRSALAAFILAGTLHAQVPQLINYQGRVAVAGVNFEGTGQFKFALVDGGVNLNTQATATALVPAVGGGVLSIGVDPGGSGSGYVSDPVVTITDPTGTGATAVATVTLGVVTSIQVTNGGSGYSFQPTVTIAPPPPNIVTTTFWSNDQSSANGSEPGSAVSLPVVKGLYSVLLGDNSLGAAMRTIGAPDLAHPDIRLRVWFNDGTNGFQLLSPDQRLAPAAYLADGVVNSANIADGAITTAKVAPGFTIAGNQITSGTLDYSRLLTEPATPGAGQVLSFNGSGLNWITPSTSSTTSGWALGGNRGTTGAHFLGTTDNQNLIFKTNNLERLRLTTSGDLVLQLPPGEFPNSSVRNGLGTYGNFPFADNRPFAGTNILGPVLYGQSGGGLGMKSSTNTETLALRWNNSGVTVIGDLTTGGNASIRQLTIRGGMDLAEPFEMKEEELENGSVVVIDEEHPGRLKRSAGAYDTRVAGIISGANGVNPGIALHQEGLVDGGQNVALSGRVYVQADATGAPIKPGDLLTTSDTPGHAMKVTEHTRAQGAVIGKAMSSLNEGTGLVLVLVTLQ